jgi:hypothetical protein
MAGLSHEAAVQSLVEAFEHPPSSAGDDSLIDDGGDGEHGEEKEREPSRLSPADDSWEQLDFSTDAKRLSAADARQRLRRHLRRLLAANPRRSLLQDKVTFVLGSMDLWLSAYWLGASPATFHVLYTFKTVVLLLIRWYCCAHCI